MFQGNWQCSKCGAVITELPFEPRSSQGLTCRDCYFKDKNGGTPGGGVSSSASDNNTDATGGVSGAIDDRSAPPFDPDDNSLTSEPAPAPPDSLDGATPATGERKMYTGDWNCATCGGAITQLPFQPRSTENLKCIDCFKKSKS